MRSATELLVRLLGLLEEELQEAKVLRRRLHAIPEPGYEEHSTADVIAQALPVEARTIAGTGLLARLGGNTRGVLVRAEMDGLPIVEATGVPFASRNGHMHACGHDVHMAALVALVRAARRMEYDLPVPLVAMYQPSEEKHPSGALELSRDPELRGSFDAVVAAHVHPFAPWGTISAEPGPVNAASDAVRIFIEGTGGHGAYPHRTRDPVLALAQTVVALHGIVGRRIDPMHGAVITVGAISAGATENVIPAAAEARATLRALDPDDQSILRSAVQAAVEGISAAHGCVGRVEFTKSEPPLINDRGLTATASVLATTAGFGLSAPLRSCGGDDFARLHELGPLLMVFVGLQDAPDFIDVPLHHPQFLPPEEAVGAVARALALAFMSASAAADPITAVTRS